jgi:hypothetical protein
MHERLLRPLTWKMTTLAGASLRLAALTFTSIGSNSASPASSAGARSEPGEPAPPLSYERIACSGKPKLT